MKVFTLALTALATCALTATAAERHWNFTEWSAQTKNDLHTEALTMEAPLASKSTTHNSWRAFEKWDATNNQEHIDAAYWWGSTTVGVDGDGQLYANGNLIEETAGLKWKTVKAGNLAIAVDYPETSLGTYAGSQYLWIGGSNLAFAIPDVKPGSTITMEVESHKLSDGRGLDATINGTALAIQSGSNKPKEKTTCVWVVPSTLSETSVEVLFTNNNGCHVYSIDVVEPDATVDGRHFAYVFDSNVNPDAGSNVDDFCDILSNGYNAGFANMTVDKIDLASETVTLEQLTGCDVVVYSSAIAADNAQAGVLRQAVAYVPVVNMNAQLYQAWGEGTPNAFGGTISVADAYKDNLLFKYCDKADDPSFLQEDGTFILADGQLNGVKFAENSFFAKDNIVATDGNDVLAIHQHNANRNTYIFLPFGFDQLESVNDEAYDIYTNALILANVTKQQAPQTAKPAIEFIYKNQATDVKLTCSTKGSVIYYTLDGSDPTDQSTLYTGIISGLEANTTVKAIAYNLDGYTPSEVAEDVVKFFDACNPPIAQVLEGEGETTVTLSQADGNLIYYNLDGTQEVNRSGLYSDQTQLVFTHPTTLYAFATTGDDTKLPSEAIEIDVTIKNRVVRDNVLSHFDANKESYSFGESKAYYFTEGKKNGYNYFIKGDSTLVDTTLVVKVFDEDLGEDIEEEKDTAIWVYDWEPANKLTAYNAGDGWEIKTYGQGMLWEVTAVSYDLTVEAAYHAATPLDYGASNCFIQFGNVQKSDGTHNDPYSGMVQSTEAFQGPFDVTCFITSGSNGNHPRGILYLSPDTLDESKWVAIDTVWAPSTNRWHQKTVLSYDGGEKMFVRLQCAFSSYCVRDIIVSNCPGEEPIAVAISEARETKGQVVRQEVFAIDGKRINGVQKGVNIVRRTYENGAVETHKVVVK